MTRPPPLLRPEPPADQPAPATGRRRSLQWMLTAFGALAAPLLPGCAIAPPADPVPLLRDELFAPVHLPDEAKDVFALSDSMRLFAAQRLLGPHAPRDRRKALIDALYDPTALLLGYDTSLTRTAAQAFDGRAGNCLSLVIMTAAFARHLELPVRFQSVNTEAEWSRSGGLFLMAGHVNIVVGATPTRLSREDTAWLTIDFLPQVDLRHQRADPIAEATVVAMFMNNRAAEALAAGAPDEAYAWARAAVRADPGFVAAINTLGVVYHRGGHDASAETAWRHALAADADNVSVLANLVALLNGHGRGAEAAPWAARLARLQPEPPFWWLDRAREALARGDADTAITLLGRELRRQPGQHEVHFELARAHAARGEVEAAQRQLALARQHSPTVALRGLYAGKLDRLRAARMQ